MSGIAEVLLNLGYRVSGSDLKASPLTERLARLGGRIVIGHAAENVQDAHVVVISSAVRPDNVEVLEAKRRQVPVIPRAEMLAELMRLKYSIAVAGAHGKTTTTSMLATVLDGAGLDPTVVIGGRLSTFGSNARLGKGELIVAEADESDRSFLKLSPTIAVVTNIDREHMDQYSDLDDIKDTFVAFVNKVPFYGAAVLCLDDENVRSLIPRLERRVITYGTSHQAEFTASKITLDGFNSRFIAKQGGRELGPVRLRVPGQHNVLNALAAIAVVTDLGVGFESAAAALAGFPGADRRFQIKGERDGILVVDDYGHHPTEIRATLAAARAHNGRRIIVVFQPHRYTRTLHLFEEFCHAFFDADVLILTEIYPAGEEPIEGVSAEKLAEKIKQYGHREVAFCHSFGEIAEALQKIARPGDLILTLGAGDVWKVGEKFLSR